MADASIIEYFPLCGTAQRTQTKTSSQSCTFGCCWSRVCRDGNYSIWSRCRMLNGRNWVTNHFQEKGNKGRRICWAPSSSERDEPSLVRLKPLTWDFWSFYVVCIASIDAEHSSAHLLFELTCGRDFLHQLKSSDNEHFFPLVLDIF